METNYEIEGKILFNFMKSEIFSALKRQRQVFHRVGSDVKAIDIFKNSNRNVISYFQPSGWRKLRNIVQWTPFFQTYKKQRYPWVQLAGHQGNYHAFTETWIKVTE